MGTKNLLLFFFPYFLVISFKNLCGLSELKMLETGYQGDFKKIRYVKQQVKSNQVYDKW